ncbi:MAG: helix-turn-helix domain-containing protein [Planctomycetia bacterium]|nr:helix-turn-helix domain-containing protein [Planctomycetia bacterium]
MAMIDVMLTKEDVSKILGCSLSSVDTYRKKEGLPFFKLGHAVRFSERAVLEWLESKAVRFNPKKEE